MRVTKNQIKNALLHGGIATRAESMINGGTHRWWAVLEKDCDEPVVHCYGRGPGWHDQDDSTTLSFEDAVDHLYRNRKRITNI